MTYKSLGILSLPLTIWQWEKQALVSVEAGRPPHCAQCKVASRPPGKALRIYGHGTVDRQAWGPYAPSQKSEMKVFPVRRYRCLICRHVMRVGPSGVPCRRLYAGAAIALALVLWTVSDLSQQEIRSQISPLKYYEPSSTWKSLGRWKNAAEAQGLWSNMNTDALPRALQKLSSQAHVGPEHPYCDLVFSGAAHTRREVSGGQIG